MAQQGGEAQAARVSLELSLRPSCELPSPWWKDWESECILHHSSTPHEDQAQLEPLAEPLAEEPWRTHISRTDRHQQDSSYLIPNGSCQQRTPWAIVLVGQAQRVWVCLSQATATIYASKFVPKLSNRSGGFCHKDAGVVSATSWVGIWEISGQTREPRYETIPYRLVYSWF